MDKKSIPLLTADDIECRVQQVTARQDGTATALLLLYKDARVDMRILDQVYGSENWQRTHEVINGNLFCNIDIWDDDKKCWVRKQDVGTESNTEKEKGQASDAFKRAGFNCGIGRELYTAPTIRVQLNKSEYEVSQSNGRQAARCKPWIKFRVSEIGYDDKSRINQLTITDGDGRQRFRMGSSAQTDEDSGYTCTRCGNPIVRVTGKQGTTWEPHEIVEFSRNAFGETLCPDCQREAKKKQ